MDGIKVLDHVRKKAVEKPANKSLSESQGKAIKKKSTMEGSPSSLSALVRDYFLVVSSVPGKKDPAFYPCKPLVSKIYSA
jgi:hypothetical protein